MHQYLHLAHLPHQSIKQPIFEILPTTTGKRGLGIAQLGERQTEDLKVVTKTLLDDAQNGFKNGNFVCSPLSLETILGMLAAGAEGETLKQLLEFLGHESIDQLISESQTQILSGVDVSLANGVWVEKRVEPIQSCY
ncbi:serpin-ZX [Tanacetum coccineum]